MIDNIKQWCEELPNNLTDKKEHVCLAIQKELEVASGWHDEVNMEYCNEHNIPVYDSNRNGGTIVFSKGNIALGYIYKHNKDKSFIIQHKLVYDLADYFKQKGLDVKISHNDILIDDYKVCSCAGYNIKPDFTWTYEAIQISINQDLDAIKNICKKEMVKIPKALSDYGFTTEELYQWCLD